MLLAHFGGYHVGETLGGAGGGAAHRRIPDSPSPIRATQQGLRRMFAECLDTREAPVRLCKNLRKAWETNAHWVLRLPPWIVEPLMGHVGSNVAAHHYDKPSEQVLAGVLVEA